MIGWLSGTVLVRDSAQSRVLIDVSGVGYEVRVSLQTLAGVGEVGSPCQLWIHTHVREDVIALYGFRTEIERQLFLQLINVPKIGPKNAMAVLGGLPLVELITTLAQRQESKLEKIPGIGKKTAEQILLSMADKMQKLVESGLSGQLPAMGIEGQKSAISGDEALKEEARLVLTNLGWKNRQVEIALAKVSQAGTEELALDELVRRALAQLMERT